MQQKIALTLLLLSAGMLLNAQTGFTVLEKPEQKQVDVLYNGKLLTAYCYYDSIFKPVLFPVNTPQGVTVTRGYPVAPRPGERTDHPHHIGIWMNYESVNGLDFWNNSTAIPQEKKPHYGSIRQDGITRAEGNAEQARISATASWLRPDGKALLQENSDYHFSVRDGLLYIDRTTKLTALKDTVDFKDVKDGFFAIRVARELEMPSTEPGIFLDAHGNATKVAPSGKNVSGMYYNAEGLKGDDVWSSQSTWAMLKGKKDGQAVTIAIFDHPSNPGFPAYWHARGYGLFAVNPLGRSVFSKGKDSLNYRLLPGASVQFRYLLVTGSRDLDAATVNSIATRFQQDK
ncbi:hypothetical protein GCM10027051_15720 [Niabella terrae]